MDASLNLDTRLQGAGDATPAPLSFLSTALEPDELGRLDHYRVLKILGQGGMGVVLLAEDTHLQRRVALKVIHPEIGQTLVSRERFLREARAMAQVRSDHVVAVYQVGQAGDVCYLAMELLEGEPLDRWLEQVVIPPLDEVLRIGREIALALAAAHARGLVHRDVKPSNVWLETPARRVKLLDFGLARMQAGDARITNPGMVVGTPAYMAPEQAQGEPLDGRADLFSLGCVLYQMVTGRPPFQGETALAVMAAVVSQTPPPASQINAAIPAPLSDLLSRLLAKRPADRPASAEAVGEELRSVERAGMAPAGQPAILGTQVAPAGQAVASADLLWSGIQPQSMASSAETLRPPSSVPLQSWPTGASETSRRRAREAERRQVTALVCGCELFESEAYLGLETEDQAQILKAFQLACEQAVRRLDGTVVQCNEQGLMACFGYPAAYEDAASRAAEAGLCLLQDVRVLGGPPGPAPDLEVKPWVGLHTGLAIVEVKEDVVSLVG
ncbi:MAG TPA: protein kinase, partial [Gemmataceae bacterium]|nr:protein kinase [Gemmataceae bacterium]